MIEFRRVNGRDCPFVFCDSCGKRITKQGNVLYHDQDGRLDGPIFVHKGICDLRATDYPAKSPGWLWEELDVWLVHLVANSGVDMKKAAGRAKLLEEIGQ